DAAFLILGHLGRDSVRVDQPAPVGQHGTPRGDKCPFEKRPPTDVFPPGVERSHASPLSQGQTYFVVSVSGRWPQVITVIHAHTAVAWPLAQERSPESRYGPTPGNGDGVVETPRPGDESRSNG